MKNIIILAIAILTFSTPSNGQITKGYWLVGGDAGFFSTVYQSEEGQHNTGFVIQIAPDIGYFFTDKFIGGLKTNISKQGSKGTGTSVFSTYTDFNIGPFIRYYFLPADNMVNIVTEGAYQYGFIKGDHIKILKNMFSLAAGPVIFFNSAVGLEFLAGYSTYKYVGIPGNNGTVQMSLGFQVYLEK